MKPTKNDHIAFAVSDMEASVRFYTEKLGLQLLSRSVDEEEKEEFAFLALEGGSLELIQWLDGGNFQKPSIEPPYCPHLALATEDMAQTLMMIQEKQLPVVRGPLEIKGMVRWIYISDPDNNIIEYIQWLDSSARPI